MEVRSLGYRTDLLFPAFDGVIIDRGPYLVIKTPSNPAFYWGNFILFRDPPGEGDLGRWKAVFAGEIGPAPGVGHMAFGWDTVNGESGAIRQFLDDGFNLNESVVLSAREVRLPPKYNREAVIRPLTEDWEWEQATKNQVDCRGSGHGLESYGAFKAAQMQRYRKMTQAGRGSWFGAFLEGALVADLGIFAAGTIGRFQQVGTHPDFRRMGVCGALVHESSRYALERMGLDSLVMVADENYHAAGIYESIGFAPEERQLGLDRWKEADA